MHHQLILANTQDMIPVTSSKILASVHLLSVEAYILVAKEIT